MALTDREQQTLDEISRRVRAADPALARLLSGFGGSGGGPVFRRRSVALVVVLMLLGVLLTPQGTAHGLAGPRAEAEAARTLP